MPWEAWAVITGLGGLIIAALTLAISTRQSVVASAKSAGANGERMNSMRDTITNLSAIITGHTAQIAEHEGTFKVINTKLDSILKGQEETHKLLMKHLLEDK